MNNVIAKIYNTKQRLEAGFLTDETGSLLLEQPAQLSSPTRPWERAAALEGVFSATLYVQSAEDLTQSDLAVTEEPISGQTRQWRVLSHANSGPEWRLELSSREVRRGP
ncbi:hypothetical protein Mesil_1207 [Allomeiothermus silvanus DSM 9946]|uniref:Uncharacterized protein n=1 Tax=Allomeiothermus silvanus (strain ATCC 700542 / DSM 9946 / NBRC 106475 / NCIMB 13440 / VI-R2) TaxID=526227 RepID=D7BDV3_ALLS1|nr:hypothetical protein [Allomeiothermus silvanus]ADH63104.1 hypothetical protein Mesil_1207 [Allomeiothermus silvanus DSM 9946]